MGDSMAQSFAALLLQHLFVQRVGLVLLAHVVVLLRAGGWQIERGGEYLVQRERLQPLAGIPQLREALSRWYRQQHNLDVPAERIMITPGGSGALLLMSALLVNPGQGILMTDPGYPCNRHFLRLVEGRAQLVPVSAEQRFQLTASVAEQYWRDSTVGVMVASPSNPTGTALTTDEMQALLALCQARGGYLIVDEIYQDLVFGDAAASVLGMTDQAFVLNSFSKYFGPPDDLIPAIFLFT